MSTSMTLGQAKAMGRDDGTKAVDELRLEEGVWGVRAAVAHGQPSWVEAAINAGAFESACSVAGLTGNKKARAAYYGAYEAAACDRAREILDGDA